MLIFWIGMFQLSCLAGWIIFLMWKLFDMVGSTPSSIALVIIATPLLRKPISRLIVKLVVHQLDTFWTALLLKWFSTREEAIVHDGLPFGQGIGLLRTKVNENGDSLFIVYPCKEEHAWINPKNRTPMEYNWNCWNLKLTQDESELESTLKGKALDKGGRAGHAVLYLHGGGFVAANAAVLLQEAVTMAREGMTVYTLDYPLAPDAPFPKAVVSILDALKWLRSRRGVQHVTLVGDSAGGSLACYASALASSPRLLKVFVSETGQDLPTSGLPCIAGLISIYGVLDAETYKERLNTISWLEWKIAVHGLTFCLDCYMNPSIQFPQHVKNVLTDPKTMHLLDFPSLPPTLLVCGALDPLVHSTLDVAGILKERGVDTTLKVYSGRHAFVGLPRAWMGAKLKSQAAQADTAIRAFLMERNCRFGEKGRKSKMVSDARSRLFGENFQGSPSTAQMSTEGNIVGPSRRH